MANAMKFYRSGHQSGAGDPACPPEGKLFALAFWAPLVSSAPMLCLGSGTHVLALVRSLSTLREALPLSPAPHFLTQFRDIVLRFSS